MKKESMSNLDTVLQAIELARHAGADQAEAISYRIRRLTVEVGGGEVETIKQAEDIGIAVRVIADGRAGLSYATDFDTPSLRRTAERAVEVARASDADEFASFAEPAARFPDVDAYDPEMTQRSPEEKIERALAIERAAKAHDPRVVVARRIGYSEREYHLAIANTRGLAAEQRGNHCSGGGMVVARQGNEQQMGVGSDTKRRYAEFDPAAVGVEAAQHAVELLGASVPPTMRASILLEPKMTAAFIGIIGSLVCADNVQKGKSLLAGKIGKPVAAAGVTIVDDGAHPGAAQARAWDDEGVPSQHTLVIADGILQNYLHSTYTARKAQTSSTGNARRPSLVLAPSVMPSNFVLMPGQETAESLRAGMASGLWVRQLMNLHTANPISGEFSFGANGLWIEHGAVARPVCGVTISGNLTELLTSIRGIANELIWDTGMGTSAAAPTVLIENVSIAGK